jgi:ribonucleotide monophosphatase NagD (HAD superfamily)
VLVVGGPGIVQAVGAKQAAVVDEGPADAVVVGFTRDFDFGALHRAQTAILGGARLIGTNDDATYPTPDGPIPGGGALLAAVAKASGLRPVVAGKPFEPMAALVHAEVGPLRAGSIMVGDRLETDGDFAAQLKVDFGLVRSGVTPPDRDVEPQPAYDAPDLAALVDRYLARAPVTG